MNLIKFEPSMAYQYYEVSKQSGHGDLAYELGLKALTIHGNIDPYDEDWLSYIYARARMDVPSILKALSLNGEISKDETINGELRKYFNGRVIHPNTKEIYRKRYLGILHSHEKFTHEEVMEAMLYVILFIDDKSTEDAICERDKKLSILYRDAMCIYFNVMVGI